nr:MAG TPA: hypothetical protein [Caudoviricetes sp.]
MQELDQFKTKMLTWAKKLAQDLTALNKKIKAARPIVSEAPMGIVPGAYEGQIMVHKSGPMIKCYCWANRDWNEIGEISQSVLNNLKFEISNSILTKAGQSQERKPRASTDNMGKLFVNYGTCTVEVVDSTGNWKLLNGPLQNSGIPNYTPETGSGTLVQDTNTKKIYMWNGASWIELGGGGGAAGNYVTREEFNNALKKIQEEVSKIRG